MNPMNRVWVATLLAWTAFILAITLSPGQPTGGGWVSGSLSWLHERGLPAWVDYSVVEVTANVVLFVPFGIMLALTLGRRILWPTVIALAMSLSIEFTQAAFLPERFATASDIAANTAGGFFGASLVALVTVIVRRGSGTVRVGGAE
jgi:VanZ family protein